MFLLGFTTLFAASALLTPSIDHSTLLAREIAEQTAMQRDSEMIESCQDPLPEDADYSGEVIHVGYQNLLNAGGTTTVKIHMMNKGNVPWFGDKSNCPTKQPLRLGTSRDDNRISSFWPGKSFLEDSNSAWLSPNRIMMKQSFVKPNEIATFEFEVQAPANPDVYAEYFKPLIEGGKWFDNGEKKLNFLVGEVDDEQREKLPFLHFSAPSREINLDERNVIVDISDQKLYARIGERVVYTFPISSGTPSTPTPFGTTQIYFKQNVRISSGAPHYIMPLYQAFRSSGAYGFHALPSLANDKGVFWREALNHIGEMRSHGCIRLLPWDAETFWEFTDVGVPVTVRL